MAYNRLGIGGALLVALLVPLALAACGRKGGLDPPPSAATPPPPAASGPAPSSFIDPTTPTGEAQPAQPAKVQTTQATAPPPTHGLWKSFVLDPLIQ